MMDTTVMMDPEIVFAPYMTYARWWCKVSHDGGHHVAVPMFDKVGSTGPKDRHASPMDDVFKVEYRKALCDGAKRDLAKKAAMKKLYESFPEEKHIEEFADEAAEREYNALCARKKRFRRKAYLNEWTHFVTVTYDSSRMESEDEFRTKVNRRFSYLHDYYNWRYMGVWERGEQNDRLHFHALVYVPEGAMIGAIYEKNDYSHKLHARRITHSNTYFERKFGRNDFDEINQKDFKRSVEYILKYLEKSGERIRYSRGIPTEICLDIDIRDVVIEYNKFGTKFVLLDGAIDFDRDVATYTPQKEREAHERASAKHALFFKKQRK